MTDTFISDSIKYIGADDTTQSQFIKENIDEPIFMFALFKCRKSDKGRS